MSSEPIGWVLLRTRPAAKSSTSGHILHDRTFAAKVSAERAAERMSNSHRAFVPVPVYMPAEQFLAQERNAIKSMRELHERLIAEGYEWDGMDGYYMSRKEPNVTL